MRFMKSSSTATATKKRGRPRKSETAEVETPRKRGRRRKAAEETAEEAPRERKKPGRKPLPPEQKRSYQYPRFFAALPRDVYAGDFQEFREWAAQQGDNFPWDEVGLADQKERSIERGELTIIDASQALMMLALLEWREQTGASRKRRKKK